MAIAPHLAHTSCAGGEFLIQPVGSSRIFTPESFSEEQMMFFRTADDFSRKEVLPKIKEIEEKKPGVLVALLKKAGELGLFSVDIPRKYGGLGADKTTSMLMTETITRVGSFAVSFGAHTGIGTLPLVHFGTEEQKSRYLPKLATGELLAAYALTEPESGSDALAATTRAQLTADGKHYVLNGIKQFITNAAFADLFTVFAQVDGDKFTALLVERNYPGVEIGPEEHKLGIRGSSTCQVILNDVRVPVENVLGQIGRGHKIAFTILNVGRWKLGVGAIGAARESLRLAAEHAAVRKQFGKPIGTFGLVSSKLARIATLIYAGESMAYRTAGLIDKAVHEVTATGAERDAEVARIIEEYTIEASILKVFGSEALDYAVDESLQIHGGYGYVEDYPIERLFRDSRINRIFEGTNEINRLIITGTLLKRAMRGQIAVFEAVGQVVQRLAEPRADEKRAPEGLIAVCRRAVEDAKSAVLYTVSVAGRKLEGAIKDRQEVLGNIADALIDTYAMESAILRTLQLAEAEGEDAARLAIAMTRLFCVSAHERVFDACREILMWITEGEEFGTEMETVNKLYVKSPIDAMTLRDDIAGAVLENGGYMLKGSSRK